MFCCHGSRNWSISVWLCSVPEVLKYLRNNLDVLFIALPYLAASAELRRKKLRCNRCVVLYSDLLRGHAACPLRKADLNVLDFVTKSRTFATSSAATLPMRPNTAVRWKARLIDCSVNILKLRELSIVTPRYFISFFVVNSYFPTNNTGAVKEWQ